MGRIFVLLRLERAQPYGDLHDLVYIYARLRDFCQLARPRLSPVLESRGEGWCSLLVSATVVP